MLNKCPLVLSLFLSAQSPAFTLADHPDFSADAETLRAALTELYPSYDRYDQGDALTRALDALDVLAGETTDPMVFYQGVAQVAAAARDEHVIAFPPAEYRAHRRASAFMPPFTLRFVGRSPVIAAVADPAHQHLVGQTLLRLNDEDSGRIRDRLERLIPGDGRSETFRIRRLEDFSPTQNENYFDLNYPIVYGEYDAYTLTVADTEGTEQTLTLDALDWVVFSTFYRARFTRPDPIVFEWLDETTAYLSVSSFHGWRYEETGVDAEARLADLADRLNHVEGARLVLDLRRNEGGGDISSRLLDYLLTEPFTEYDAVRTQFVGRPASASACENAPEVAFDPAWSEPHHEGGYALRDAFKSLIIGAETRAPEDTAFAGPLVVLISGATGSAAAKVAAVLDREERAMFVGEETGGAAAGATAFGYCALNLDESGIRVDVPLIRFERDTIAPYGRGVLPDRSVAVAHPGLEAADPVLAAALEMLNTD